jgi:predicted 3-demethylubiquinone-9 3-methyltransferase (glyoxalase superfamily)
MQIAAKKLTPCLWFDTQAEEAAKFYVSVFKNSKLGRISHYGQDVQGKKAGSVMVVEFDINGQTFTALNGGPQYKFTEAVSFQVACDSQEEIDYFWSKLSEGGEVGPCGWLKRQIRTVLAGVSVRAAEDADGFRQEQIGARDGRLHENEKVRPRCAGAGL